MKWFIAKVVLFSSLGFSRITNNSINNSNKNNSPIAIVGREFCFESSIDIPIGQLDEAKKAAANMANVAPFAGEQFFIAKTIDSSTTRLNFFVIKQNVYDELAKLSWIIIPEPLLVMNKLNTDKSQSLITAIDSRELEHYHTEGGYKSSLSSIAFQAVKQSAQHDVGEIETTDRLEGVDYINYLLSSLIKLHPYVYLQAFNLLKFKRLFKQLPYKIVGASVLCVATLYLTLSSAWLYYQDFSLAQKLENQRSDLEKAFTIQKELNTLQSELIYYYQEPRLSSVTSHIWPILIKMLKTDAELLSVSYRDGEYTVRIKSIKATDIVQFFSDQEVVVNPRITSAVVKSRGKEIITLVFSLNEKGLH